MQTATLQPNTQEHREALKTLGLKVSDLTEIGTRILAGYNRATPHDAANAAGSFAYFDAVKAPRDILRTSGWIPFQKFHIEFTAHPEMNLLLMVSSGDKNTGFFGVDPKTKNPKGNQTLKVVNNNAKQMSFWPEMEPQRQTLIIDSAPTWILLYHVNPKDNLMRMELSLPIHFDLEGDCVDGWRQRIILDPIGFSPSSAPPEQDFASDFDIEIKRKTL
jgi:hypothetical protein